MAEARERKRLEANGGENGAIDILLAPDPRKSDIVVGAGEDPQQWGRPIGMAGMTCGK